MRRFELVEGSSSKFWEIELQGKGFTVRFGKLGASGQTQSKEFDSEAKAQLEHDKLVVEKTKKGYAEVSASASAPLAPVKSATKAATAAPSAPTPAPIASPTPAAAAPGAPAGPPPPQGKVERDLEAFASWRKWSVRLGHRKSLLAPIEPASTPASVWSELVQHTRKASPQVDAAYQGAWERAQAFYEGTTPGALDPQVLPIAHLLACAASERPSLAVLRLLGRAVFEKHGARGLVAACAGAGGLQGEWSGAGGSLSKVTSAGELGGIAFLSGAMAWFVRELPDADYEAVCAEVAERFEKLEYPARAALLELLPGCEALAEKLGAEWLSVDGHVPGHQTTQWSKEGAKPILRFRYPLAMGLKLAKKAVGMPFSGGFLVYHLPNLLDLYDTEAMPFFELHCASVDYSGGVVAALELASLFTCAETASLMVSQLGGGKDASAMASRWLEQHPALGMVPLAAASTGSTAGADRAAALLLKLDRANPGVLDGLTLTPASRAAVERRREALAAKPDASPEAVPEVLRKPPTPVGKGKAPRLPDWFEADGLPRPLLSGRERSLPLDAVRALALLLAGSTSGPSSELAPVRAACDKASLEAFSWGLFNAWLNAGANSKEGWAFQQLGWLGGDDVARKLTPLLRAWPGESQHARAVSGLEVLARIGSDLALMHLNGVAQKVKFKGLQEKAREKMSEVAARRGLTAEELADRLVPDLDLDEDGSRTLDFGPRQFRVGFDEALVPFVKDSAGKVLSELPKPAKTDDAAKSREAQETWKTLKKDVKSLASLQLTRLELAMCARRRWEPDSFRALFLEHPLLIHPVRRLLWGVYDAQGRLQASFRVAEDNSLSDSADKSFALPEEGSVGLVHPLELEEKSKAAWGQLFGDYALAQPFPQLGRDTYSPTPEEARGKVLERRKGQHVPVGKILGLVEQKGWRKGPPQDAGWIWEWSKPLPGGAVATLDLRTGIGADMQMTDAKQELGVLVVNSTLGALDPVVFSELVRDLMQLGTAP